jgi:hypothetical protein
MFLCILEMVNALLTHRRDGVLGADRAPAPMLDGVRRANWTTRPDAARRLGAALAERGEVAYWVGGIDERNPRDRRADALRFPRMRSAKRLDAAFRYLCDCRICVRAFNGLKILLARNVRLPRRFAVHIDETGERAMCVAPVPHVGECSWSASACTSVRRSAP